MERRYLVNEVEVRSVEGDVAQIAGYAALFNRDSQPLGWDGFVETIARGAFKKTLKEADVRALFNHDPSFVLGRTKAGTLRLSEDTKGLHYEDDMDLLNSDVNNVYRMIERGDVSQSSFGFTVVADEWSNLDAADEGPVRRTLKEVKLFDVSPVTYPAYLDTEVETKSALESLANQVERPLDELVDAVSRGELRSYLSTPGVKEPDTTPPEPATSHSDERTVLHLMPPSVRLALITIEEDIRRTGAA